MILKMEATAGTRIENAAEDAQRIANLLRVSCEFDFNGVTCIASPGGNASWLAQNQQDQQRKPDLKVGNKFAFSNREPAV